MSPLAIIYIYNYNMFIRSMIFNSTGMSNNNRTIRSININTMIPETTPIFPCLCVLTDWLFGLVGYKLIPSDVFV